MNAVTSKDANSWEETLYLLADPANAEHLRQSLAEAKADQVKQRELVEEAVQGTVSSSSKGIGQRTPARR